MGIARARFLRNNATDAERRLWGFLRQLRHEGYHFRRQVPIGSYYADFACHHARLIIELDGDQHGHNVQASYDAQRDAYLRSAGYTVVRFPNAEVYGNIEGIGSAIFDVLRQHPRSA